MDTQPAAADTTDTNAKNLAELLDWLTESLEPERLARFLGVMADTRNIGALGQRRADVLADIVAKAPRQETHADIAARLGITVYALRKALGKARRGEASTSAPQSTGHQEGP